jgi:hypothetical protein
VRDGRNLVWVEPIALDFSLQGARASDGHERTTGFQANRIADVKHGCHSNNKDHGRSRHSEKLGRKVNLVETVSISPPQHQRQKRANYPLLAPRGSLVTEVLPKIPSLKQLCLCGYWRRTVTQPPETTPAPTVAGLVTAEEFDGGCSILEFRFDFVAVGVSNYHLIFNKRTVCGSLVVAVDDRDRFLDSDTILSHVVEGYDANRGNLASHCTLQLHHKIF